MDSPTAGWCAPSSDCLSLAPDSKIRAGFPLVVLYTNILFGGRCKLIKALDQTGPFHILLDEMGKWD